MKLHKANKLRRNQNRALKAIDQRVFTESLIRLSKMQGVARFATLGIITPTEMTRRLRSLATNS